MAHFQKRSERLVDLSPDRKRRCNICGFMRTLMFTRVRCRQLSSPACSRRWRSRFAMERHCEKSCGKTQIIFTKDCARSGLIPEHRQPTSCRSSSAIGNECIGSVTNCDDADSGSHQSITRPFLKIEFVSVLV